MKSAWIRKMIETGVVALVSHVDVMEIPDSRFPDEIEFKVRIKFPF